jgi:hypothetical protein
MIELIFIYILCFVSAAGVESRFPLNNLLERILVVLTLVAAQLILAVQLLSLFHFLTGGGLLLACLGFALAGWGTTCVWPSPSGRLSWKTVLTKNWAEMVGIKEHWPAFRLLTFGAGLIALNSLLGAFMIPLDDSYHFEKPLFWIQNRSIAPFVASNPRINVTSLADAALCLPGYLYCRSGLMFAVITFCAGIMSLGVVFSLARKLGCSWSAAACASVLTLGFSGFALSFLSVSVAFYLAALWGGASLLFLMECQSDSATLSTERLTRLGFSVACFLMACGAKNTTIFLAPFFLVGLAICVRRFLFKKKAVLVLAASGTLGLLCSGTAWNYIANIKWYGNPQGPPYMQEHLSRELNFRSVWTRLARGTTLLAFDFLYVPASARDAYGTICQKAVRIIGGKNELSEDADYYSFQKEKIAPRSACGLVGVFCLLPALVVSVRRMTGKGDRAGKVVESFHRINIALLLLFGFGYFLICHTLLRWQSIGLWRLMPVFPVIAAPLLGLLMERFRGQLAALLLVVFSTLLFLTFDAGIMARRFASLDDCRFLKKLTNSGRQHAFKVECQWTNEPPQDLLVREDYSSRQIEQKFMERVDRATTIAFVGDVNSDAYYLFGRDFSNTVIPLNDSRNLGQLLAPPENAKYLVFGERYKIDADKIAWASSRGYLLVFQALRENEPVFMGFTKIPTQPKGI